MAEAQLALGLDGAMPGPYRDAGADFDPTRTYRSRLWRIWDRSKPMVLFVGLNPSKAGGVNPSKPKGTDEDKTTARWEGFARSWDCGGYFAGNLFDFCSTDPKGLFNAPPPGSISPACDVALADMASRVGRIVACWGAFELAARRAQLVLELLTVHGDVWCLGRTKDGAPRHPLYLAATTPLELYAPRRVAAPLREGAHG